MSVNLLLSAHELKPLASGLTIAAGRGITVGLCLLIVDEDAGFAFWLAHVLDSAGYQAFPAREVHSAFYLLRNVPNLQTHIQAIIITVGQNGAEHLIDHCRQQCSDLAVAWLYDRTDTAPDGIQEAWYKPVDRSSRECAEFLVGIGRLLARLTAASPSA